MSQPSVPTPPSDEYGSNSLNVDTVIADDRGGTTLLPADPDVLAQYLAECRKLERRASAKKKNQEAKDEPPASVGSHLIHLMRTRMA